jgi:hypothetical protein
MKKMWPWGAFLALAVVVAVGGLLASTHQTALGGAKEASQASGAHYTVVETEGHNLIVTDNATNTLYFYTVDKGEAPGADLKLRGTVDLSQVGKPVIKPKAINIQK